MVSGTLVNQGVLRKTQPVGGVGEYFFGLAGLLWVDPAWDWLSIDVTARKGGNPLTAIQVDCIYANHPHALGTNTTGVYWTIAPVGSDFTASVILPQANLPDPQIGRYRNAAWSWGRSSFDTLTVTWTNLTTFGDFAVFNNPQFVASTTNTLTSSLNPSTYGSNVTFTATVSPSDASGPVTFKDGATTLGTGTLSSGVATFTTNGLAVGDHLLTALYGGDASYSGSTSGVLTQTVTLLVTTNATYTRGQGLSLKILLADIAWDTSGRPVGVTALGASAAGATLTCNSNYIFYASANDLNDSFNYTVSNGLATATGTIGVNVATAGGLARQLTYAGGSVTVKFFGIPGLQYQVERTTSLTEPVSWERVTHAALTPGADGSFLFIDATPPEPGPAYYRCVQATPDT